MFCMCVFARAHACVCVVYLCSYVRDVDSGHRDGRLCHAGLHSLRCRRSRQLWLLFPRILHHVSGYIGEHADAVVRIHFVFAPESSSLFPLFATGKFQPSAPTAATPSIVAIGHDLPTARRRWAIVVGGYDDGKLNGHAAYTRNDSKASVRRCCQRMWSWQRLHSSSSARCKE